MGQSRASRSSLSAGTPDSLSDNESSFKISARKTSTSYRSTVTPGKLSFFNFELGIVLQLMKTLLQMIVLRCLQVVAVHLAGQLQDLPPDLLVDQAADLPVDKEVNRLVDTDRRSRWMVRTI